MSKLVHHVTAFVPCLLCALAASLQAAEPLRDGEAPPTTLVLKNGRVVQGTITQSSGGYVVDMPQGRMVIPTNQVQLTARSKTDAYRQLREMIPPKPLDHRLSLAAWCVTNQLYYQAQKEVNVVLRAEPGNRSAQRMSRRIQELLDPKHVEPTEKPKTLYDRLSAPETTSLAGLSPDVARGYVAKVQPILMNSCALSGCHGPRSENGFRLSIVHLRAGSRAGLSEQNLAATLRYVDTKTPARSPLLVKPLGNHGRRGRSVFRGSAGSRQLAELRDWVRKIAAESKPARGTTQPASAATRNVAQASSGRQPVRQPQTGYGARNPLPAHQDTPAMRGIRSLVKQRRVVKSMPPDPRKRKTTAAGDPFDPAEFNRKNGATTPRTQNAIPVRSRYP